MLRIFWWESKIYNSQLLYKSYSRKYGNKNIAEEKDGSEEDLMIWIEMQCDII